MLCLLLQKNIIKPKLMEDNKKVNLTPISLISQENKVSYRLKTGSRITNLALFNLILIKYDTFYSSDINVMGVKFIIVMSLISYDFRIFFFNNKLSLQMPRNTNLALFLTLFSLFLMQRAPQIKNISMKMLSDRSL